jgi:hypothetical protein
MLSMLCTALLLALLAVIYSSTASGIRVVPPGLLRPLQKWLNCFMEESPAVLAPQLCLLDITGDLCEHCSDCADVVAAVTGAQLLLLAAAPTVATGLT